MWLFLGARIPVMAGIDYMVLVLVLVLFMVMVTITITFILTTSRTF
jgi:hypothetical protein